MLSLEQKALFKQWSQEKRVIAVVVRSKTQFFGPLEEFKKPDDVALIAFVTDKSNGITARAHECFDIILLYNSKTALRDVDHFDDFRIPDLETFGEELKELVDLKKLHVFYSNESAIAPVCRLRETLRIDGAYLHELEHIRNKDKVKEVAAKNNITIAKSITLNFDGYSHGDIPIIVDIVEKSIGHYPIFKRPISLAGCNGAEDIKSRDQLIKWMHQLIETRDTNNYLVEEYLVGREFLAIGLLVEDGTFIPLVVKYLEFGWSNVLYRDTGRPIPVFLDTFHNVKEEFPGILDFVQRVVEAFKPPGCQIFAVQGFQMMPRKDDYVLVELAHRPAGPRTNSVCYQSCGISQETACLMVNIDSSYHPSINPRLPHQPELALWFPQRRGILREYTALPIGSIKSSLKAEWLKPLGTKFQQPKDVNHHMLILTLFNENRSQLLSDAKWIADNWRPVLDLIPE